MRFAIRMRYRNSNRFDFGIQEVNDTVYLYLPEIVKWQSLSIAKNMNCVV